MNALYLLVGLVAAQRLAEAVYAEFNRKRLLRAGGSEVGARHYPLFVALHFGWLAAILLAVDPPTGPNLYLLALYGLLQLCRGWVLWSLGRFWTTRIIVVPDLPLVFGAWQVALAFSVLNSALLAYRIRVEDKALAEMRAAPEKSVMTG